MAALITPLPCDLAVVGAGIVGTMVAHLAAADHPDWTILLVDRGSPGRGATMHSLALDVGSATNPAVRHLVAESAPITRKLAASMPACFRSLSAVAVVDAGNVEVGLDVFSAPGARIADAGDLRRLLTRWPELFLSPGEAVLTGLTATSARPAAVVDGLVARMRRRGVRCWEGAEVVTMESKPDGVALSMADGRTLLAARVVLAVGPWITTGCWREFADQFGVRVKKVVAMHLDIKPGADDPVMLLMADDAFLLPDIESDRYLFSFASREWDCLPDAAGLRITPDDREVAFEILRRRLPGLARRWSGGRVFCDAYVPNRAPLVAGLDTDPRVCIATGAGGSGFRLAPGMALAALNHLGSLELLAPAGQPWS